MDDETWSLVEDERRTLADLLEPLTPEQWSSPSLCAEWRIRDVAAHLGMTPGGAPSVATMLRALLANRGRLWAAGRDVAVAYAAMPTAEIVAGLRRDAAARTRPVFVVADNILPDLVIHGQDIAVPLQITRPVPAAAGRLALARIWSMGWPFHARRRLDGVSLRADDCDWTAGNGPELLGSAGHLLLLMTGRVGAVERVRGPGADVVGRRVARDQPVRPPAEGAHP
ncbi:maleylpyruvate isomerase family mycothiol-dependent enzyme [uncultured Friedmanniella sp.]|uniref:maleylpyruvate isomerase family mycothiol-dependent enzyme n=1 Tax=uncultured Friedmanniella sp. TaxID=335381 RepID=UPI0035CC9BF3